MANGSVATDNRFTKAFGTPSHRATGKVVNVMTDVVMEFIANSPFLVMATSSGDGGCDASPKGGKPGFVHILDDRHIIIPDVAGIPALPELPEYVGESAGGAAIPDSRLQRYGEGQRTRDYPPQGGVGPDEGGAVASTTRTTIRRKLQGILVEVDEAYTHCPRALKFAELWNPDAHNSVTFHNRDLAARAAKRRR